MKILLVHNHYIQPGGEDAVFEAEVSLLRKNRHKVSIFIEDNSKLKKINPLKVAIETIWSKNSLTEIQKLIKKEKPNVVHFHNTFLRISPAAYYACKEAGVPVVQTLHNYRLICPGALLFRKGRVCEQCVGKAIPWPGVLHGCWRNSRAGTALVTTMLVVHRLLKTWTEKVDIYIALTEFARKKFIEGGLPAEKIMVKPNFVEPDPGAKDYKIGDYVLFVGRLSQEKGLFTLLKAWKLVKNIPLKIVGDGPLRESLENFVNCANLNKKVEFLGRCSRKEVIQLMHKAQFLVFSSEWYECFPMTIAEAFACGLPVVVSRLGAMAEIVENGCTGLHFNAGDTEDLAAKVEWAWTHPQEMAEMGREARREYEAKYTAERNYEMLMEIYRKAIEKCRIF